MSVADELIQTTLLGEALDDGPALIFVADEHMRYAAVNAAACAELGYAREELLQMCVDDVCRYAGAPVEFDEMLRAGSRTGVSVLTRKDGSTFRLRYVAGETRLGGLQYYISVGWAE